MRSLVFLIATFALITAPALAAPALVTVKDKGVKTDCAEEDNVYAVLSAPGLKSFEVQARHPAYGAALKQDTAKPNFKNCVFQPQKDFPLTPRNVTLYRDGQVMIRGITYSGYWRPTSVRVDVAGRKDQGFTLIQFFQNEGKDWRESLVLHAPDGYWRLRPLPLPQFKGAVYGSSFLIGPVEAGRPFVALRSMYVAPDNADTAELHWTGANGERKVAPVVGFGAVQASAVGFEKSLPSLHNTSAPDIIFEKFEN